MHDIPLCKQHCVCTLHSQRFWYLGVREGFLQPLFKDPTFTENVGRDRHGSTGRLQKLGDACTANGALVVPFSSFPARMLISKQACTASSALGRYFLGF